MKPSAINTLAAIAALSHTGYDIPTNLVFHKGKPKPKPFNRKDARAKKRRRGF